MIRFLGSVLALLCLAGFCPAQTDIASAINLPVGGNAMSVRFGQVNLATGNLGLDIPLYQYANARGVAPFVAHLRYNSTVWQSYQNGPSMVYQPVTGSGWKISVDGPTKLFAARVDGAFYQKCPPPYTGGGIFRATQWVATEADGTQHTFNVGVIYKLDCYDSNQVQYPGGQGYPTTGSASDLERTGYFITVQSYDSSTIYQSNGSTNTVTPNGNQPYSGAAGNQYDDMGAAITPTQSASCSTFDSSNPQPYTARASYTCTWGIPAWDGSGSQISYSFQYSYIPVCTHFTASGATYPQGGDYCGGIWVPSSVTSADGSIYQFSYDQGQTVGHYGQLLSITLPTNGVVSYQYAPPNAAYPHNGMYVTSITDHGGAVAIAYSTPPAQNQQTNFTSTYPLYPITVTYPAHVERPAAMPVSVKTVYSVQPTSGDTSYPPPAALIEKNYIGNNVVVQTERDFTVPAASVYFLKTWVETGDTQRFDYSYYSPQSGQPTNLIQDQTETRNGVVLRKVHVDYLTDTATIPYVSQYHMSNYPTRVQVKDAADNVVAETDYTYDDYTHDFCGIGSGLTSVTGVFGHDDTHGSSYFARGNPTTISRLMSGGTFTTQHRCYDTLGNVTSSVDGNGYKTSYSYTDNFADSACLPPNASTHGLPTAVTNPLGQTTTTQYYSCLRSAKAIADPNDLAANRSGTVFTFDPAGRPLCTNSPNGGQQCRSYPTSGSSPYTDTQMLSASVSHSVTTTLDSFGNVQATLDNSTGGTTSLQYDQQGLLSQQSAPYQYGVDTPVYRQYFHDGLGRPTVTVDFDGTSMTSQVYSGPNIDSFDEIGNHRKLHYDAAGQLVGVDELGSSSSSLSYTTAYGYDTLGNLTSVQQNGGSGDTSRLRSFTYNGLSWLITAHNPETGTVCYGTWASTNDCEDGYDGNGNLLAKTDARNIVTAYSYDAGNRLLSRTYTGDASGTASACFQYDNSSIAGAVGNLIGRVTSAWTQKGSCPSAPPATGVLSRRSILSYNEVGRVLNEQDCTMMTCGSTTSYMPSYTYDLAGNVLDHSSGINSLKFTNGYDSAGRLATIMRTDSTSPSNLFSSATYSLAGGLTAAKFGTGLQLTRSYDTRLRITGETDTGNVVTSPTAGTGLISITGVEKTH